jgi:hypothetical protein
MYVRKPVGAVPNGRTVTSHFDCLNLKVLFVQEEITKKEKKKL